ncbi:MAG: hypothetical protein IJ686_04805 [Bacteroidales bacterium]|nr:hypothetical protein [Bacteroidales bacterium]
MKRTIPILLTLSVVIASCGCLSKTAKGTRDDSASAHTAIEAAATDSTISVTSAIQTESLAVITDLKEDETVITEVYEYDTAQPADSVTGHPPVKRYTRQERQRSATKNDRIEAGRNTEVANVLENVSSESFSADSTSESHSHEEATFEQGAATPGRRMNGFQKTLCWIGGLTILLTIVSIIIKLKF